MSEGSETELRPHTRRMKGHLIDAINASSQGADFRMSVSQQLLDDLQEAIFVLSLVDLGKSHLLEANSHTEPT